MKPRYVIGVGVVTSVAGLAYAFAGVDVRQMAATIRNLRPGPFWTSQALFVASLVLRAMRWRLLLQSFGRIRFGSVFGATVIGMMANNFLPGRIGELPKALFLGRREQISNPAVIANIVAERVSDTLALLALLGAYVWVAEANTNGVDAVAQAGWVLLVGSAGVIAILAVIVRLGDRAVRLVHRAFSPLSERWAERMGRIAAGFVAGLRVFHSWQQCVAVAAMSLAVWLCGAAVYFFLMESFALRLGFLDALLVFLIVLLGIALPSAPGFVGTFHAVCVAALALVGVTDTAVASAYATVAHAGGWVAVNVLGLACLGLMGGRDWNRLLTIRPDTMSVARAATLPVGAIHED